jgi:hypothetical protein
MDVTVALLTAKAQDIQALGLDYLLDGATHPIRPALELEVLRFSEIADHAFDVSPRTYKCVPT